MGLLEGVPLLSIDDILPLFPDFIVIDTFKSEICTSLDDYNQSLISLKAEISEYTRSCIFIHREISDSWTSTHAIPVGALCALSGAPLIERSFLYFTSGLAYRFSAISDHLEAYLNNPLTDCCPQSEATCPLTGALMIKSIDTPLSAEPSRSRWDI